jgi:hypothetical protein
MDPLVLMVEVVDDDERYDVNLVCREEMIVTMARNKKLKIAVFGQKRIPSREGGVEIVVEELATRVGSLGNQVTVYNRSGHHVSCSEFDEEQLKSYKDVHIKTIPTIQKKGLAAVSSFFASLFVCCKLIIPGRGCGRNPGPNEVINRRRSRTCIPTKND